MEKSLGQGETLHERIDGKPGLTRNGKMIQEALQALGEDVDTPVIGNPDCADRPLWTTPAGKREIDILAEQAFEEISAATSMETPRVSRPGFAADHLGRTTFMGVRLTTPEDIALDTYPYSG